jgi:exopolyphosphatase/guanosine-5'-triphosphate,3'-diphosphate pyrophosphatase
MSFHMMHARRMGGGDLVRLGGLRLATGLGSKTMQQGVLDSAAYQSGLADLGLLCEEIRALAPDRVVAVATSAIRAASNAHAFIAAAREQYQLEIEVLSPEEEAQLCYQGAASELIDWSGPLAVVDLGGGSCEVALGQGRRYQASFSADIGVLPLREAFDVTDRLGPIKAGAMAEVVRMSLRPASGLFRSLAPEKLLLASGSARAVHKLARSVFQGALPPGQMTLMHMRKLREYVVDRHPKEFLDHGVGVQRACVIATAVIVLETLMSQFSCLTAEVSSRGLREGVVLREFARPERVVESTFASFSTSSL